MEIPTSVSGHRCECSGLVKLVAVLVADGSGLLGLWWFSGYKKPFPNMKEILRLRLWMTWAYTLGDLG